MTGEECSQPPLGRGGDEVAEPVGDAHVAGVARATRRCATRSVRTSSGRTRRGCRPARPRTARGRAAPGCARAACPGAATRPRCRRRARGVGALYSAESSASTRDLGRVAVPRLPVGEGELGALDDRVDEFGRARREAVEPVEQRELLQQHRSLPPRAGLADGEAAEVVADRALVARGPLGHVVRGQHAGVPLAGGVPQRGAGEGVDLGGDEAPLPRVERVLDLGVAVGRRRLGLVERVAAASQPRPGCAAVRCRRGRPRPRSATGRGTGRRPARWSWRSAAAAGRRSRRSGRPARAPRAAGAVPWSRSSVSQAAVLPGTAAASSPEPGIRSSPSPRKCATVAPAGAGPCPQSTVGTSSGPAKISGRSPPGPFRCGSATCRVNPAATAASKALPPASSRAIPTAEASQCVEDTMPTVPCNSGRVVNTFVDATGGKTSLPAQRTGHEFAIADAPNPCARRRHLYRVADTAARR